MDKYILYIGCIFMPDKNAASQRAKAICKLIQNAGFIPIIIGFDKDRSANNILDTKTEYLGGYYYYSKYPSNSIEWLKSITSIKDIVTVINNLGPNRIHAIIAMDYYSIALSKLILYCKRHSILFIADAVDWFIKPNSRGVRTTIKTLDTFIRMRVIYKNVNRMIVISKYLKEFYKKNVNTIVEIPGVVTANNDCADPVELNSNKLNIVFAGDPGIHCEKEHIDWLIDLICSYNKKTDNIINLYVAGVEKQFFLNNNPRFKKYDNLDESIIFLGRINHPECLGLISACDFSSIIREDNLLSKAGFPTKLGESFSCGTPVIATPTSNIKDYIPDTHGFLSDECTKASVSRLLQTITMLDKTKISEMRKAINDYNPLDVISFIDQFEKIIYEYD